jgi:RimJ/RimL family protein N-acetyltransferase
MVNLTEIVSTYRDRKIKGRCIDFVPLDMKWAEQIVKMRNLKRSAYFFNQLTPLTIKDQQAWYEKYLERTDDIYWCILDKQGRFIGTVRLYNITSDTAEHGSFMIDSEVAKEAPYA